MQKSILRLCGWGWAVGAFLVGLVTVLGGIARWSASVYQYVALVPGSPYIWAVVLIGFALLTMVGLVLKRAKPTLLGLRLIGGWVGFFGVGVIMAGVVIPSVAFSGGVWLLVVGFQILILSRSIQALEAGELE